MRNKIVALAVSAGLAAPGAAWGQAAGGGADLPPAAGDNPKVYGNTPPELVPFSRFKKTPYSRFFVDPLKYYGPWRNKPEPEVETVKIGLLAPLERSGEAYLGRDISDGVVLAFEEANAEGGYRGKPFELVVRNDTGLWGASANEIVRFAYEDETRLVIGTVDGANTHIAIRVALKAEMPMINVGDLDPTLVETKIPWVVRVMPDDRQEMYTLAFYLYRQLGLDKVAVVRADNRYGRFGVREFIQGANRLGRSAPIEVNLEVPWRRVNPDFDLQLERLKSVRPEAVVVWADAAPAGRLVRRMREEGLAMPVFACDRILHPDFVAEAGEHAEGVVAATPYDPTAKVPALQSFRERYRKRFGKDPTNYAAHGYDGAWLGVRAVRKAGLNWAKIRDALAEATQPGVTGPMHFDDVLSNRRRVTLATWRGGQWVYGEPKAETLF